MRLPCHRRLCQKFVPKCEPETEHRGMGGSTIVFLPSPLTIIRRLRLTADKCLISLFSLSLSFQVSDEINLAERPINERTKGRKYIERGVFNGRRVRHEISAHLKKLFKRGCTRAWTKGVTCPTPILTKTGVLVGNDPKPTPEVLFRQVVSEKF